MNVDAPIVAPSFILLLPLTIGRPRMGQRIPSPIVNSVMNQTPPRYPVTCEIDGKTFKGTYWIAGKILTVSTGMGGKA